MGGQNQTSACYGPVLDEDCHLPWIGRDEMEQACHRTVSSQKCGKGHHPNASYKRQTCGKIEHQGWPDQPIGPTLSVQKRHSGGWVEGFLHSAAEKQQRNQTAPQQGGKIANQCADFPLLKTAAHTGPTTRVATGISTRPSARPRTPSIAAFTAHTTKPVAAGTPCPTATAQAWM